MRIPTGTIDQYLYFVAVDATDLKTRKTGLTGFTVYRARNGASAASYTTPTVAEVDAINMPGVYALLMDEDMTIGAGNDSEEICYHITKTGMAPVTRTIELYRRPVTGGETLGVSSGAVSNVTLTATATTLTNLPAITAGWLTAAGIAAAALNGKGDWNVGKTGYSLTQTFPTNFSSLSITAGGLVDPVVASIAGAVWNAATAGYGSAGSYGLMIETNLDVPVSTVGGGSLTVAAIADGVWDEVLSGHLTGGTTGAALNGAGAAGDPWGTALPGAYTAGSAGYIMGTNLNATVSTRATQTSVDTIAGYIDTEVAAIKTKTDFLPSAAAGAAGGVFIAGANAATTVNFTGNLSGSVGSVSGSTAQTGDSFARLGAPAGASTAADIAAVKAQTATIQTDTDDIQARLPAALVAGRMDSNLSAIGNSTTSLTAFQRAVKGNVIGTVGVGSTTTSLVSSSLTPAGSVADKFKGRLVVFADDTTTANLRGQATDITANTSAAAPTFTITALTTAAVSGDTFVII